ncbi:MAG: ferrous iron transport protein A [Bacilli bacterium]|nr:ferrous iron transport protein A [Bacilli bacterium]
MCLSEARVGNLLKIKSINIENVKMRYYLMQMGVIQDTYIQLLKKTFFQGPIIILLRNYKLCLSLDIASKIMVEIV